ncbi:glutaredoxin family protein [Cytobacillus sp. IB215316]|uniref:glutaredoxin family protein n=1 Tax=Cytobacillus sp. IB215316 TaxID=3097354 RepID=UPI002A0E9CA9|nr:glutaredoxin family protein [Cytobacillus sp. IB215316]MDX8360641.1 glutaredoxin family protein [Cytobacillus sp. IB215316]
MSKTVIMYTKENCPLCDKAQKILVELQAEIPFQLELTDIYKDDQLLEKYQVMIPVVEIAGEEIAYGVIHKDVIKKRLQQGLNG